MISLNLVLPGNLSSFASFLKLAILLPGSNMLAEAQSCQFDLFEKQLYHC